VANEALLLIFTYYIIPNAVTKSCSANRHSTTGALKFKMPPICYGPRRHDYFLLIIPAAATKSLCRQVARPDSCNYLTARHAATKLYCITNGVMVARSFIWLLCEYLLSSPMNLKSQNNNPTNTQHIKTKTSIIITTITYIQPFNTPNILLHSSQLPLKTHYPCSLNLHCTNPVSYPNPY
jgi:hypothetical protein